LQTVNSELKLKLEMVSRANSDLQNLMEATDFGTLFVDSGLRIKRFTDRVSDLFRITPADEGRPITDFARQLDYDDLVKDAQSVLANLTPVRREVRGRDDSWYDVRMRPYRTVDNKIDGVVITFIDLSERRRMEEALRDSERQLREQKRLVELSHEPIFVWDFDDGIIEWNRGSEEIYGYTHEEALGKRSYELLETSLPGSTGADLRTHLQNEGRWSGELRQRAKDGRELVMEARIELEAMDGRRLVLESAHDITDRKQWERRQQLLLNELTHRVKNTLSVVQAIAHHTLRNSASSEDFVERFDGRLSALANSHGLLVESDWKGTDFAALAREQLAPYISGNPARLRLDGEPLILPADLATPFGLVLHELATNAAKYGALARPSGAVELSWTRSIRNDQPVLSVRWLEKGGPPVNEPTASGFGSSMINNGIPTATVRREFRPEGLICTIEIALPELAEDE
jgi:two-component system CheB/CheR fusion protein